MGSVPSSSKQRSDFHNGGNTATLAAFTPHRPHLSCAFAAASAPAPHARTISAPVSVRTAPQLPHSIRTLAPKRTRSAAVRMCLVDMPAHYSDENDR